MAFRRLCFLLLLLISVCADVPLCFGQTGQVSGRVTDPTGAVVSGARVRALLDKKVLAETTTDGDGRYTLTAPKPGEYSLEVSAKGFAKTKQQVSVALGDDRAANFSLTVQPLTETVTVSATDAYIAATVLGATKTDTPLNQIPQSIQVINRTLMDDQHVIELGDAARNVSGVTRASTDDAGEIGNELAIRGFALSPANNYFVDGFRVDGEEHLETANLEQVEIIKGPASVLYGRMEPGGIVNLVTKKPLDKTYYSLQMTGGSFGLVRPQFDVSGPLNRSGTLLYRLNLSYLDSGSFRDFVDGRRFFAAPVLTWQMNPSTSLMLSAQYLRDSRTADFGLVALGQRPAPLPISTFYGEPFNHAYDQERQFRYVLRHTFGKNWMVQNAFHTFLVNWNFLEVFQDTVDPAHHAVNREIAQAGFPREWSYSQTDLIGIVNTGRFEHKMLFGFEFGHQVNKDRGPFGATFPPIDLFHPVQQITLTDALQFLAAGAGTDFSVLGSTVTNRTIGGYWQDQISLTRKLKALVGVRLEQYRQRFLSFPGQPEDGREDFAASPRAGLLYQVTSSLSLYSSFSQSFSPVFATEFGFGAKPFSPTRGRQYEGGAKFESLRGRLLATAAIYFLQKENVLTPDPNHLGFSIQTGTQKSKGVDFDIVARPTRSWNLLLAYGFSQAQITADNRFPVGNLLPNAPRHTASVWSNYEVPRGPLRGLGFGSGIWGVSRKEANLTNTFLLPGYVRLDESISYMFSEGKRTSYKVSFGINNLLDKTYYETATSFGQFIWPGAPRSAIASFSITHK